LDNSLLTALIISLVGMTLLFLSLILFYGLLLLLAAVFKDRPATLPPQAAEAKDTGDRERHEGQDEALIRAAIVAVALARAEAEVVTRPAVVVAPEGAAAGRPVSAWWSLHHQRQITTNPDTRRSR
jgi:Na+-transporting methylmalonyl-CoA/oxaloacetate decarboxylase gamma subunit